MITLDGSKLEGGGQILRTALALSVLFKKPCRIFNIRKGRKKPGLKPQHLAAIQALTRLCHGSLKGDKLSSEEITFYPGNDFRESISIKIRTAGSVSLVLQTLVPLSLSITEPLSIKFKGGATDTFFSPTLDHFDKVFLQTLRKHGVKVKIKEIKRGYYPEGGAVIEADLHPSQLKAFRLTKRGELKHVFVLSGASETLKSKKVAERQIAGAKEVLGKINLPLKEEVNYFDTACPGSHICLIAKFKKTVIGVDNLGKINKRAENVGKEAALELLKEEKTNACLDKHTADQILPYLALSNKKSQIKVSQASSHCKTNIWVIEKFAKGSFKIDDQLITWTPKK